MNPAECIEVELRRGGYRGFILGCDEVGRGPLAGPATVCCVAFPIELDERCTLFAELDDSKKLSEKKRIHLVPEIEKSAAAYCIEDVSVEEIDRCNILGACLNGMRRAAEKVVGMLGNVSEDEIFVIVDGNRRIPDLRWNQETYVKGDGRSWSIAAASILAKEHRDSLMREYAGKYPGYGFEKNVGYPTAAHRAALLELGPTPIHRKSFKVKG